MDKSNLVFNRFARLISNHKRYALLALLLVTITVSAVAVVSSKRRAAAAAKSTVVAQAANAPAAPRADYVHRGRLWPHLRDALGQFGDRLEKPGRERLALVGTLSHLVNNQMVTVPVRIITEFPHKVRIEEQGANQGHITGFDGGNAWQHGRQLNRRDKEMIESLVYDSADHFFQSQMQGASTRSLGMRFRLDDGTSPNYTGPFYDVYQVTDQITVGTETRTQIKRYYFNSNTLLLERVRYNILRDGDVVSVEVEIPKWHAINGQQLPVSIIRRENGDKVMEMTITSGHITHRVEDGIFNSANGN